MDESTEFLLLPAIDLRGGRVVRLERGDFGRETDYGDDPLAVASRFADAGASAIHLVDLDGASQGRPVQGGVVERLATSLGSRVRCEVAGGLRTAEDVAKAFRAGAWRVVVGTAAIRDPELVAGLVRDHGAERIVIALDVRRGQAVGDAWRAGARGAPVDALLADLADAGATIFEVTAIDRDGLLGGPDLELLARLAALGHGRIIASGGVTTLDDLRAVRMVGCAGAIVGRAIYEGRLDLASAVRLVSSDAGS
jgi:phosphoribosylformimino-5-aminoimidazole carboxamide ribotide isomerase